jgi:hypothetical protein
MATAKIWCISGAWIWRHENRPSQFHQVECPAVGEAELPVDGHRPAARQNLEVRRPFFTLQL